MSGEITIYACGGTGTAISSVFEKYRDKQLINGFAKVTPYYIDTSLSDISDELPRECIYAFEDTDGSGKLRRENNELIKQNVNDILHKFRPADVSIIVSSASGGSGAVIAGYLLNELLRRRLPVIVVTIGSEDSRIELENTIKTLKSYEKAAQTSKTPVVMSFWHNDVETPRDEVNKSVESLIRRLSALFSRQHKRLDMADLANWLNYTKVTDIEPRLVLLDYYNSAGVKQADVNVISAATLCLDGADSALGVPVEYQAVGYVSPENNESIQIEEAIHFCIVDGAVATIFKSLNKALEVYTEHRRSKAAPAPLISKADSDSNEDEIFL